jgi:hypothetical protein
MALKSGTVKAKERFCRSKYATINATHKSVTMDQRRRGLIMREDEEALLSFKRSTVSYGAMD